MPGGSTVSEDEALSRVAKYIKILYFRGNFDSWADAVKEYFKRVAEALQTGGEKPEGANIFLTIIREEWKEFIKNTCKPKTTPSKTPTTTAKPATTAETGSARPRSETTTITGVEHQAGKSTTPSKTLQAPAPRAESQAQQTLILALIAVAIVVGLAILALKRRKT